MAIVFNQMPNSYRVPGPYAEIDGTKALSVQPGEPHHTLLIGMRLTTGNATQGQIKSILGELDGDAFFDAKSQLAAMCRAFKRVNRTAKLSAMAMDAAGGGTAATGTFPLVGTATADGTLQVRIGDQRIAVRIASGTAAAAAATALNTAINATERLPMSGGVATATVTVTARHAGTVGNDLTIEVESIPAGLTCTPTQPSGGATNPTMATAIGLLAEDRYDTIVLGWNDATSVLALENEMARRWGPTVKQPGLAIIASRGSHGTMTAYGAARNSAFSICMGSGLSPTPPWVWAAQVAARDAEVSDTMPNRPRNGRTLPDCEAPKVADRLDADERNLLLYDGISTFKVDQSGNVMIEKLITTYQTNTSGQADVTYLDAGTQRNLADLYLEALGIAGKYGSYVLVPDADALNVDPGVPALSPRAYKGELVAWYGTKVKAGQCKDLEGFAETLRAEINATDTSRLDVEMSPRLVNGLGPVAHKISFQL